MQENARMTVSELKVILRSLNDDADVMVECSPEPGEYRTEYCSGVRVVDGELVIMVGVSAV